MARSVGPCGGRDGGRAGAREVRGLRVQVAARQRNGIECLQKALPVFDPTRSLSASIQACDYRWIAPKCSRTVNLGMLGTYTANRGYPPCGDNTQQSDPHRFENQNGRQVLTGDLTRIPRTKATGTFRIRIYGKVCEDRPGGAPCALFREGGIDDHGGGPSCARAHRFGYTATSAPGPDCGPPEWPTGQMRTAYENGDMRYPPYARWCDFTVTAQ